MTAHYREFAVPVDPEFARELKVQLDERRVRQHLSPEPSPADDQAIQLPRTTEVTLVLTPNKQPKQRWRRAGLVAAAAVVVLAAGTMVVLATSDDDAAPRPAATLPPESSAPATVAPPTAPEEAVDLAQSFLEARDAWDGEAVRALVTDDAVIDDLAVSNPDDYLAGAEVEQATGWRYMQPDCFATVLDAPVHVTCTYLMQNAWSEAIGVGPFSGSSFKFVMADGQIQQVTHHFEFSIFDPQVFAVFEEWLTDTHPDDVDVMFNSSSGNFSLTPEAIALFEQHTTEFVSSRNNSGSG